MYNKLPDGSIKQINPFTGTEVWYVPGRGFRPPNKHNNTTQELLKKHSPEDYCHFCEAEYLNTPPEKARLIKENGDWKKVEHTPASKLSNTTAEFRRIPNLFEIVSYDYWVKNYNYKMPEYIKKWRDTYLSEKEGRDHILRVLDLKLRRSNTKKADMDSLTEEQKLRMADAFFAGAHELIIGRRHYTDNAKFDNELCSAGELTQEEHFQYTKFTVETMQDILRANRYVRYISIFQNWLAPAGASFDHLHKQLVGLDEWGVSIEREISLIRKNKNLYNEFGINFSEQKNLVIAENDYAIAVAEIGHRFPTIAIYSKSVNIRPFEHTPDEIRGISDIVHACHSAMTSQITCNEEWYYSPIDSVSYMPWHILIKWRTNNPAGFEGNTKIYINPVAPEELRDTMVQRLFAARDNNLISKSIKIAEECVMRPNKLEYYKR